MNSRGQISPWSNDTIAPVQAAGAVIPVVSTDRGNVFQDKAHGTAFFLNEFGWFLTAAHVLDDYPNEDPPVVIVIVNARGFAFMPIRRFATHPTLDIALGMADVIDHCKPCPMTLANSTLEVGAPVAVLGYPNTRTQYKVADDGQALSNLSFRPDYYEGTVLEHHPNGVGLVRGRAYSTDVTPPLNHVRDLGGASGGPLVHSGSLQVHGILCSAAESYALCLDIAEVLDWEAFFQGQTASWTIREFAARKPTHIRLAR